MRPLNVSRFLMTVAAPLSLFPATFLLQLKLGYDVSLFPLYMIGIAALSWHFGTVAAVMSVAGAVVLWVAGNFITGTTYSYAWALHHNAFVRLAVFVATAYFILMFRRVVEQHRRRMEAMRALLNVCHGCGAVQGSDGRWIPLDRLTEIAYRPTRECPDCRKVGGAPNAAGTGDSGDACPCDAGLRQQTR